MPLKRSAHTLLALLVLLTGIRFAPTQTHADTTTVVPPKFEMLGNPGDILKNNIKVSNSSDQEESFQVEIENFRAEGEDGSINLLDKGTPTTSFSLASWITVEPSSFTVPAGQEKVITFNIRIPKTGEPGGHYASILVHRAGQVTPGAASVDTRIGSLVLLRVSGDVKETAELNSFTTNAYSQYGPINFSIRFTNKGNVHVAPTGNIVITNMFGKKVKEIPVSGSNVLPDSSRLIQATWDETRLIGRYTATYIATYGQQKIPVTASTSFFVFPIYLIFILLGILIAIYLMIAKRKGLKRIINRLTSD